MRLAIGIGVALLLAACAQQPETRSSLTTTGDGAGDSRSRLEPASAADWARVERVAFNVFRGGSTLCGRQAAPAFGVFFANRDSFDPAANPHGADADDLDDRYRVTRIVGGSPAARAGLQAGDILVSLGGRTMPSGPGTAAAAARLSRQAARPGQPVAIAVERAGVRRQFTLTPVLACDVAVVVQRSSEINAYTNGSLIQVRAGLLRFVQSDDELALVLAHEVGHSIMKHATATKLTMIGGAIMGGVMDAIAGAGGVDTQGNFTRYGIEAGSRRNSVAHELQADYIGLYVMALAGYDIAVAAPLWRRMAAYMPGEVGPMPTHPAPPERIAALERAAAEIRAKRAGGLPLTPDAAAVARLGRDSGPPAAD